jgi:predicted transcriptional regulator
LVSLKEEVIGKREKKVACISPDGKPTESGTKMLRALKSGLGSPEEIAKGTGLPLFKVRSGLRELAQASLVEQNDNGYELSPKGIELVGSLP